MPKRVTGGDKLEEHIRQQRMASSVKGVKVGFFSTAKYPDGTPVTNVAAWNEFGTEASRLRPFNIPERPFMRPVAREEQGNVRELLRKLLNSERIGVTRQDAGILGEYLKAQIQAKIVAVQYPPNSPTTVLIKGSSNPLVDTGFMRQSVSYEVVS